MSSAVRTLVESRLEAYRQEDRETALDLFRDGAVLYDPHYPEPQMPGKEAIGGALGWAYSNIQSFGFTIRNYFEADNKAAVEVNSDHVMGNGQRVQRPQVFIIETQDGKVARLQAYEPYPPPAQS